LCPPYLAREEYKIFPLEVSMSVYNSFMVEHSPNTVYKEDDILTLQYRYKISLDATGSRKLLLNASAVPVIIATTKLHKCRRGTYIKFYF
jgi:hypothetical protein